MKYLISILSNISRQRNTEFGQVVILVLAVSAYWSEHIAFLLASIIVLSVVTILLPAVYTPFTALWYGFSRILGIAGTSLLLGIVFFLVVTPVGCFYRMLKKDNLQVRQFRKSGLSALINREHTYTEHDFIHSF